MSKVRKEGAPPTRQPDFVAGIEKTGYVLENRVAQELKSNGWIVISNRYYVDDLEETVREIDLVAYKVGKLHDVHVYTSLIISCKKSESNAWAFLARTPDFASPNADWWPVHMWSNNKALAFVLSKEGIGRLYHQDMSNAGVTSVLSDPEVDVFAFQEMDARTGAPHNDKALFTAVTSLMKAQAHEIASLSQRRKTPAVYQFNLVSVCDTDLIRLKFCDQRIEPTSVAYEQYIARYIIGGKETFARVRFATPGQFAVDLQDYARLHRANCSWAAQSIEAFYDGVLTDAMRTAVFLDVFRLAIHSFVSSRVAGLTQETLKRQEIDLGWDPLEAKVRVELNLSRKAIEGLESDKEVLRRVGAALKRYYQYEGKWEFAEWIPF